MRYGLATMLVGSMLFAQQPDPRGRLEFEVASIRLTKPDQQGGGIKPAASGNGYTAVGMPVKLMIALMYRVPMRQIKGGPGWLESDRYNVEAKADKQYSVDDLHTMYQNMLIGPVQAKVPHRDEGSECVRADGG